MELWRQIQRGDNQSSKICSAALESDKMFKKAILPHVVVSYNDDGSPLVTMSDHYRLDKEFLLAGMFRFFDCFCRMDRTQSSVLLCDHHTDYLENPLFRAYLGGINPVGAGFLLQGLTLIIIFWCMGLTENRGGNRRRFWAF